MNTTESWDCIIVGAGPGGLQAAIYLGRFNRKVLLLDRGGGRTTHARHIENFLSQTSISGHQIISLGMEQARGFGVEIRKAVVTGIGKRRMFEVAAGEELFHAPFVIVSTGATENLPEIRNLGRFFATSVFTCIDCDGYRTTGKKLVIIGNSVKSVNLALAMQEMYTKDVALVLYTEKAPPDYQELLRDAGIPLVVGRPREFSGSSVLEGVAMDSGEFVPCEVVMLHFGYKLNDSFLKGLNLPQDAERKYATNRHYESTLSGLYIVGPLAGGDQVVVAAGEGAMAAIDIKKRLIEMMG